MAPKLGEDTFVANGEGKAIRALLDELLNSPVRPFPEAGSVKCTTDRGVYIVYAADSSVMHVGRTPSARGGLRQRLNNHLHGKSSFVKVAYEGRPEKLRGGGHYRCLVVECERLRALLEALAIGLLCPIHLGLSVARSKHCVNKRTKP